MKLGSFEVAAREADPAREPDTFDLQGETFTVAEDVNIVALGRFAKAARAGGNTDDMEGLASLIETVGSLVVPEDETRFLDTASKHRVDAELLLKIVQAVLSAESGHPTEQPSDFVAGSVTTSRSSRVPSSSAASSSRTGWEDTPFGRRELAAHPELYEGIASVRENAERVVQLV